MNEREWKLGEDLSLGDNLIDGVTFQDLVLALHCNCPVINEAAVYSELSKILEMKSVDMCELLKRNMTAIIAEAMKGRS